MRENKLRPIQSFCTGAKKAYFHPDGKNNKPGYVLKKRPTIESGTRIFSESPFTCGRAAN
jgi:hypothetical protein